MAHFTVFLIGGGDRGFEETADFKLLDNGALQVEDPDNENLIIFGPAAWSRIETRLAEREFFGGFGG